MKNLLYLFIAIVFCQAKAIAQAQQEYLDWDNDNWPSSIPYDPVAHAGHHHMPGGGYIVDCNDYDANVYPKFYYYDYDGDGFGNSASNYPMCPQPPGTVTNSDDCNDYDANLNPNTTWWYDNGDMIYTSGVDIFAGNGCVRFPNSYLQSEFGLTIENTQSDKHFNWIQNDIYNINGSITAAQRIYFNGLAQNEETLTKDFITGKVWGSENLYDNFNRLKQTSYIAPSPNNNLLKINYISPHTSIYTFSTTNLADYYSNNNADEPFQATASQPYSEINYDKLNPGNVINATGGNKINGEWKTGYSYTVPAAQEMYYVYGYNYFNGPVDANNREEVITKFYKSVSVDANGIENVAFTDGEGKLLATARSGGTSYPVISLIGTQGFVDVHIPSGITAAQISLLGSDLTLYKAYNLKTGQEITPITSTSFIGGNGYRIVAITPPTVDPKVYVTNVTSGAPAYDTGALGISYRVNYYDYSVNIYNKTGQLIKNIQPVGYQSNTTIKATPAHMLTTATSFISTYLYTTSGQLKEIKSPDEGISKFIYRKDGQIRYSKSATQSSSVSYTDYDTYSRPIESGVITIDSNIWTTATNADPDAALIGTAAQRSEQTFTVYDDAANALLPTIPTDLTLNGVLTSAGIPTTNYTQNNLSGNVAVTFKKDTQSSVINAISWYSYDIYGRVEWMVQYNEGIGAKTIHYEYDANGNAKKVLYQKNKATEQFVHRYTYDLNSVITKAETSTDNTTFVEQAKYTYYKTGELKRVNLVQAKQGLDYVYTLGGQLKSINHPGLSQSLDPGQDPVALDGTNEDVFGIILDYYDGDYIRTGNSINTSASVPSLNTDQYNGNIKATRFANRSVNMDLNGSTINQKAYIYKYNRNNWLENSVFGNVNTSDQIITSNKWNEGAISYDANGNIRSLRRTNESGTVVDDFIYKYTSGRNTLNYVDDQVLPIVPDPDPTDIEGQTDGNYRYNAIGQLITNNKEQIGYTYNTAGLVTRVINLVTSRAIVQFSYNERGQRIKKESYNSSGSLQSTTYYSLDLSGNLISAYFKPNGGSLTQTDLPIYGISRIGIYNKAGQGYANYEIIDHLGNVRAVINRINGSSTTSIPSYADYYPFGEKLPRRNANAADYRFAFQGQELDTETNMEAFQLRLWDGRLGRWLSPDPMGQYDSPYLGMGNNPVNRIDPDGGSDGGPGDGIWDQFKKWLFGDNNTYNGGDLDEVVIDGKNEPGIMDSFYNTMFDFNPFHTDNAANRNMFFNWWFDDETQELSKNMQTAFEVESAIIPGLDAAHSIQAEKNYGKGTAQLAVNLIPFGKLGKPLQKVLPAVVNKGMAKILVGEGTAIMRNGTQQALENRGGVALKWVGALEYKIPDAAKTSWNGTRILQKVHPDGSSTFGYIINHNYKNIYEIALSSPLIWP